METKIADDTSLNNELRSVEKKYEILLDRVILMRGEVDGISCKLDRFLNTAGEVDVLRLSSLESKLTTLKYLFSCLVVLFLIFGSLAVRAESLPPSTTTPDFGQDFLGLHHPMFPCKEILQIIPEGMPIGWLGDATFGHSDKCAREILRNKKPRAVRVHLLNNTSVRNKVIQREEPLYGYTLARISGEVRNINSNIYNLFAREISKVNNLVAQESPLTEQYLSPLLEHDLSSGDSAIMFKNLQQRFPGQKWVDSPVNHGNSTVSGVIRELHYKGKTPISDFFSADGESAVDIDVETSKKQTRKIWFYWVPRYNLRVRLTDRNDKLIFIAPRQRKWPPSISDLKLSLELMRPQDQLAGYPGAAGKARNFERGELYKTVSDEHGGTDTKGAKPLLITRQRARGIDILASNGQKLGVMSYYGPYSQGGYRYYHRENKVNELGEKARAASGNATIFLKVNGGSYRVNAFRRAGTFR